MSSRTFKWLTGSSFIALASVAAAQSTSDNELGDIVVTARRVEERLQDVPISITVYNQEQLQKENVTNIGDLANFTPSLSANNNFGTENTSFAIRGFVQDAGTQPSVGTYFDDVVALRGPTQGTQAGDGAGPGYFFDLQNVQVLMGPQGTLFGRNTTGGAVLLVPQKPTSKEEGYIEVSAGNYNMKRVQAAVNLPVNDAIRFRLAVDHEDRDGYLNNISGIGPEDYNDVRYTAVRLSAVVDITPNLENYTVLSYSDSDTNGSVEKMIGCNPTGYNPVNPQTGLGNFIGVFSCSQLAAEKARGASFYDVEAAAPDPASKITQEQVINTTTWTVSDDVKLKNIASYGRFKDFQDSPLFGTNWQSSELPQPYPEIFPRIPALFTGVFAIPGGNVAYQDTYTEELQLQGNTQDRKLTYQAGVYFEWSDPLAVVGNQSPQLAPCVNLATLNCSDPIGATFTAFEGGFPIHVGAVNYTAGETTFRDKGVFSQATYSVTDQFKVTGGVRETADYESNTATRITNNFAVTYPYAPGPTASCTDPSSFPTCSSTNSKKSNKPTWLLDFDYLPTDDVLVYAKYTRGYRAGGVLSNAPIDHRTFDPEKVDTYEIGTKTSFLAPVHGIFNADLFYNNFSNQQLQFGFDARINPLTGAPAPVSPTTAIINAGKSRIWGLELNTSINPIHNLTLAVDYTYLNATIQKVNPVTTDDPNYQSATSLIAPGSPLVLSPKDKATFNTNYVLPLPDGIGKVSVGGQYVHTDKQITTYAYTDPNILALFGHDYGLLGSRDLLNLNIDWNSIAGSPVDLSLFATNVADKHYYQFVPGLATSGSEYASLGEPRMWGARIRYRFGQ